MQDNGFETISRFELSRRITESRPDNADPDKGFALVNVLNPEVFAKEHIPASINIPAGNEQEFEKRFSKEKDIILYCANSDCDASPTVAKRLAEKGFANVYDYEAGMQDWKKAA
jgi:rhodanese-related sulfurtransferase